MSSSFLTAVEARVLEQDDSPSRVLEQDEIVAIILTHCALDAVGVDWFCPTTLLTAACVCKRWAHLGHADEHLWKQCCWWQRRYKHPRFFLSAEEARRIECEEHFRGWRAEFQRAARDSDRDYLHGADELSLLRFSYERQQVRTLPDGNPEPFHFHPDGVLGHPAGVRWEWRLAQSARSVVIGPAESPFPPLYASREPDWTWRLESRNVLLTETGRRHEPFRPPEPSTPHASQLAPLQLARPREGGSAGAGSAVDHSDDLDDLVAVMVDGEIFYLDAAAAEFETILAPVG